MRILVITQHIFPIQTPRSLRSTELIKELANQGHDITCYAVLGKYDYSDFTKKYNIKLKNIPLKYAFVPYTSDGVPKRTLVDKVLTKLLQRKFTFPDIEFYNIIPSILKKDYDYDLLLSIGAPHQIHWGCAKAKKLNPEKFPKKWIADCGDPFMNNGNNNYPNRFEKQERNFCSLCDYITVPVSEAIKGYYPEFKEKIKVIPQGFNFNLESSLNEIKNSIPTFAYSGMFYKDIRNPKKLMDILCDIKEDFRFHIFSPYHELVLPYKKLLGDKLILHKSIPRKRLLEELKKMDFVLNLKNSNSPNQIPSKLIDYAIVQKPILNLDPNEIEPTFIKEFLVGNYKNQFIVNNVQQYHISNVVKKLLDL